MFDKFRLKDALTEYKRDFTAFQWSDDKYKLEAIKTFKAHWNVNATDLAEMLSKSLSNTKNLLASANYYPARMIAKFAKAAPEEVRAMFIALYDEGEDVVERILTFKNQSSTLLEKYGNGSRQHYQTENAISTYLWLHYPDKYYIYKHNEVKTVAEVLGCDYKFKKGAYRENLRNFYRLYDELCEYIRTDTELTSLFQSQLSDTCYPDPEYKTLTVDVGFYISRYYSQKELTMPQEQSPHDSSPNLPTGESDIDVSKLHSEARFANWFVPLTEALLKLGGSGKRPEVHELLLREFADEKSAEEDISQVKNDIDWARNYLVYEGFISNEKSGIWELTDTGKSVQMTRELAGKIIAKWIRIKTAERKELPIPEIDLSPYYVPRAAEKRATYEVYTAEDFLREVYLSEQQYDRLTGLLNYKKNVILQGPPGVGKTYAAKRLAYSMMGVRDQNRVMMVQFHQSYSYEDFIMGVRPTETGFELRNGVFYNFCKTAEADRGNDYFFIIDEINRGNLSKIFGELFMLIENDKRDISLQLLYSDEKFSVPHNVYLIGMMNTADRSLAMLDYALRRRFAFYEMKPGFDTDGFRAYQTALDNAKFDRLVSCVERLNEAIAADDSLGEGFCIGHSYFCGFDEKPLTDQALFCVVEYELIPLLKEYWFDEPAKVRDWSGNLRSAIQ